MAVQSKLLSLLEPEYGYVVFVAVDSIFVNMWLAMNVMRARKEHNVKYPIMYSPENGGDNKFNCVQRAHQNTLEAYPGFLMLLLLGGLQYPKISAGAGTLYLISRIIYARGYYSGGQSNEIGCGEGFGPEGRKRGAILTLLASPVLIGCVGSLGANLLGCPLFQ